MDAGSSSALPAASYKQSMPLNFMLNDDMQPSTLTSHAAGRTRRLAGPDNTNTTSHAQNQGWVGVQYYNQLQLGQEEDMDEPLSPQTHVESYLAQPPMVQHASLPPHRRRSTSNASVVQEQGRARNSTQGDLDQHTTVEKRSHKSLTALFENDVKVADSHGSPSPWPPRHSEVYEHKDSRLHHPLRPQSHQQLPQDSATLSLLRRGEKRPLEAHVSSRDDADRILDTFLSKRGRPSNHGGHTASAMSRTTMDDNMQSVGRVLQRRQNTSPTGAPHKSTSREKTTPISQLQGPTTTSPRNINFSHDQQTRDSQYTSTMVSPMPDKRTSSRPPTLQQKHPEQQPPKHDIEEAADQIQKGDEDREPQAHKPQENVWIAPQDQEEQHQEYEELDGREAEEVMMDVDADEEHVPTTVKQEQIQNDIRVFERTFPGLAEQYKILDKIGEGTFSSVYKAIDLQYNEYSNSHWDYGFDKKPYYMCEGRDFKDSTQASETPGKVVAIKRLTVSSSPQRIESEISILKELSGHRNVAPLITAFRHRDQVVIVLPFYKHDDFRFFRDLPLDDIRWYFRALFSALKHIHKHGIIHRDIKPTNFLYDTARKTGILVDFGLAQREDQFEPYIYQSKYRSTVPPVASSTPAAASAGGVAGGGTLDTPATPQPSQAPLPGGGGLGIAPPDLLRPFKTHNPQTPVSSAVSLTTNATTLSTNREPGYHRRDPRPIIKVNRAGTRGFRSPEILFRHTKQTVALDVWAAGVILFSFLTGRYPFFSANEDAESLIELAALYGCNEMKKVAATFNRTFVTNVPTVREEGVSFLRLCRVLHKSRFGVPSWVDSKLPLKAGKVAMARNVKASRTHLEALLAELKKQEGGKSAHKEQTAQSGSLTHSTSGQQSQPSSVPSVLTGQEAPTIASAGPNTPPSSLTQEEFQALCKDIEAAKAKHSYFYQAHHLISRYLQKLHPPPESKQVPSSSSSSSASQKPSSSSSRQTVQFATVASTTATLQDTKGGAQPCPQHDDGQTQAETPASLIKKTVTDQTPGDGESRSRANEKTVHEANAAEATTVLMGAAKKPANTVSPATTPQVTEHPQANSGPHCSQSMQPPPQQQGVPGDQRKQAAPGSDSALPLSSSERSSSRNKAYGFGWDAQEGLEDAVDLLQKLLTLDPTKRITAEEALQHRFLTAYTPQQIDAYRDFKEKYASQDKVRQDKEKLKREQAKKDILTEFKDDKEAYLAAGSASVGGGR